MNCSKVGCKAGEYLACADCAEPLCVAHYVACAQCLLHTCRPCHEKNHRGRKLGTCGATCGHDACGETAGLVRCIHCAQPLCATHRPKCGRCLMRTCSECADLFHSTGDACIEWPSPLASERQRLLTMLQQNIKAKVPPFARVVNRHGFMREDNRVYVVITALQRGDFHKFKWSIGADSRLFALLPLNEEYSDEWFKDMLGRAEALEQVAEGRWQFIHSSLVVSRRDKEGKASGKGYVLSGLAKSKLGVDIALAEDDHETWKFFTTWAEGEEAKSKLYNIDTLVPFYNSPLVMQKRASFLDDPPPNAVRPGPCDELLGVLSEKLDDEKPVLVVWGTRTSRGRDYLNPDVVAREFRHKTSKSLVRHLLNEARDKKTCILAGEPLLGVEADIDLSTMWSAEAMKQRFGINCAFGRVEQEYIFFRLAQLSKNTLHIGMQSGNIEPLINNPRTNVICVNENSAGGAGLSNVEKISGTRHRLVTRGVTKDTAQELEDGRLPSNLYLSFNLKVLPSAIGELTRRLMEKNEENVTMRRGLWMILQEVAAIFGRELDGDPNDYTIEELFALSSELLDSRTEKELEKRATVDLLAADHEHELEQILFYFADKLDPERKKLDKPKRDEPAEPRAEIQLLGKLAASCRPRVQFAIHVLNNELTAPVPTARENAVRFAISRLMSHPLVMNYKRTHEGEFSKLPKDAEPRLRALLDTLRAAIEETEDESKRVAAKKDVESVKDILDGGKTEKFGVKKISAVQGPEERLRDAWKRLRYTLLFDKEDKKELGPVLEILKPVAELEL